MCLTFFERIPQKPLRLILNFEPSLISVKRLPEKTPKEEVHGENGQPNCRNKNDETWKQWYKNQETSYIHFHACNFIRDA